MEERQSLTPIEAINEFYRLKDKYESVYYDKYVKPIIKNNKSKREKRVEFSKLPKHECINCKRNVGTIFSIVLDSKELLRKFIAKCGDISDPCPLDIQINYSLRDPFDKLITSGLADIDSLKFQIIKAKNNALFFNNNPTLLSEFERITNQLKYETEQTGATIETNILKNHNPVKINLLNKTVDEFGKSYIIPFKQMIKNYIEKNDEMVLNQAVNFYIYEMIPKLKEIQLLQYEVNFIEYNEVSNEYILIQQQNSLQSKEFCFEEDDKVVKFVMGEMKSKKPKTSEKRSELEIKPRSKRLNNKLELVEATEALEVPEGEELEAQPLNVPIKFQVTEIREKPIIEGEEVTWENPNIIKCGVNFHLK